MKVQQSEFLSHNGSILDVLKVALPLILSSSCHAVNADPLLSAGGSRSNDKRFDLFHYSMFLCRCGRILWNIRCSILRGEQAAAGRDGCLAGDFHGIARRIVHVFDVFMGALYVSIVQSYAGGNGAGNYLLQFAVTGIGGLSSAAGCILFLERAGQDDGGIGCFGSCDAAQSAVELYVDLW